MMGRLWLGGEARGVGALLAIGSHTDLETRKWVEPSGAEPVKSSKNKL